MFLFTNQVLIINEDVIINTSPDYILFLNDDVLINTQGTDAAKFVKSAAQLKAKEAKVRG